MRFKANLYILLLFISVKSFSQIWCYPGATWHFWHYNVTASLYTKHTYVYDTIILGKPCNKIAYYTQGFGMFGPVSYFGSPYFTYVNSNVVYLLDQSTNNFDTLFNYGAVIGDSWSLAPKSVSVCANSKVSVLDTGHVIIQSKFLKWLKVNIQVGTNNQIDTIIERIGCLNEYFYYFQDICPTVVDQEKGGPLRCYNDSQIINYRHMYTQACNYYYSTGINTLSFLDSKVLIYPNPALDVLYISDEQKKFDGGEIEILNLLGQIVFKTKYKSELDISKLNDGVYIFQLIGLQGQMANSRLIIAR